MELHDTREPLLEKENTELHPPRAGVWGGAKGWSNKSFFTTVPAVFTQPEAAQLPCSPGVQLLTLRHAPPADSSSLKKEGGQDTREHVVPGWGLLAAAEVSGNTGDERTPPILIPVEAYREALQELGLSGPQ